jgi:hypothetical protein
MKLITIIEAKKKEERIVFKETDSQLPFPKDTITAIKKRINVFSKDLKMEWDSPIELLDAVLLELKIPKPLAFLKDRWKQYEELIEFTIENLYDSRGASGNWSKIVS